MLLSRRDMLGATAGVAAAIVVPTQIAAAPTADALFRELDERIEAAMASYHVPGVAVGVFFQGREYIRG
jgi:hypothetical protein